MPAKTKKTPKYQRKREAVLNAAAGLFNRRGLKGTTLGDVARAVGLIRNSITYYYPTREDLAVACLMRTLGIISDIVDTAEREAAAAERIACLARAWFEVLEEIEAGRRPEFVTLFDARALQGEHDATLATALRGLVGRVRGLLQGAGAPALTAVDLDARAHLLLSLLLWSRTWVRRYEAGDFARVGRHVGDIVVNGLAAAAQAWPPEPAGRDDPEPGARGPRERFLVMATHVINQSGYHGASVDRIAERLNLSKGAFYHYIDKKSDLLADCFERSFSIIRHVQNIARARHATGWAQLCAAASMLTRTQLGQDSPVLRYVTLAAVAEDNRGDVLTRIERSALQFASMVSDGMIDGSLRRVDAVIAGHMIDGMTNAAYDLPRWVPEITRETVDALYARPLLLGILCPGPA